MISEITQEVKFDDSKIREDSHPSVDIDKFLEIGFQHHAIQRLSVSSFRAAETPFPDFVVANLGAAPTEQPVWRTIAVTVGLMTTVLLVGLDINILGAYEISARRRPPK